MTSASTGITGIVRLALAAFLGATLIIAAPPSARAAGEDQRTGCTRDRRIGLPLFLSPGHNGVTRKQLTNVAKPEGIKRR